MEISKDLAEIGLTEELLLFFHSRTANSNKKIEKAFSERYSWRNYPKAMPGGIHAGSGESAPEEAKSSA